MRDSRLPEISWLIVIGVLVALGAFPLLRFLADHRVLGTVMLVAVIVGTLEMIRRAYVPNAPSVRADVTRAVAYCAAAILALVTVDWGPHWAIRACITAAEVAIVFDIATIAARPRAVSEEGPT